MGEMETEQKPRGNMYGDSILQWNVGKGCRYDCIYCKPSFQAQSKRQLHNCPQCWSFEPHLHAERLNASLPRTRGDQFVWAWSSGDISFARPEWVEAILARIRGAPQTRFLLQTKNPQIFGQYPLVAKPLNCYYGMTLETNRDAGYSAISKAPKPSDRAKAALEHMNVDFVTIEPVMEFDLEAFADLLEELEPRRVYVGYNSKPNSVRLPEPPLAKVQLLIKLLRGFTVVKEKLLREAVPAGEPTAQRRLF